MRFLTYGLVLTSLGTSCWCLNEGWWAAAGLLGCGIGSIVASWQVIDLERRERRARRVTESVNRVLDLTDPAEQDRFLQSCVEFSECLDEEDE